MGDVVRAVGQAVDLVVAVALAQHDGVGECGGTRGNVDGGTAGEVEPTEFKGPAVGIPGPVGDGVVDDGSPDEDKDEGGQHTATVGDGADSEGGRNSGEHALVQTEEQVGYLGAADAGLAQHLHEAEVGEVTDEGAARVAEGQGVAPEEPLEADDGDAHHG